MGEIAQYRERVEAAEREVAALRPAGPGRLGPPDEETGERWDRTHVLGHMAELLPFWTGHVRAALGGATSFGRGEEGNAQRRRAIDSAPQADEAELVARVESGLAAFGGLLADMCEEDLDRRLTYRSPAGDREVDLRFPIGELLVGHVEAHLRQLHELS